MTRLPRMYFELRGEQDPLRQPLENGKAPKSVARLDRHLVATRDPLRSKHFCYLEEIPPSPPVGLPGGTHALQISPTPHVMSPGTRKSLSSSHKRPCPPKLLIHRNSDASQASSKSSNGSSPHPLSQIPLSRTPGLPRTPDEFSPTTDPFIEGNFHHTPPPQHHGSPLPFQLQQHRAVSPTKVLTQQRLRKVVGD